MRKVYLGLSGVVLLAVLAQFYFAAYGAFSIPRDHASFGMHSINGMLVIPLASLITTAVAATARVPGRLIGLAAAPFGLVVVQILIFVLVHLVTDMTMERSTPGAQVILGFHAVNALAVMAVAVLGVVRARQVVRAAAVRVGSAIDQRESPARVVSATERNGAVA